ncbi:Amino Acid/Auxin Permease (AAAP) Family [Achlya hypogyna]|uniref:Amino Acid/Auxin Permease (AAAP) Family n=1 Tax=Achlya hypogyna TaxID=1202772 RepID=A0A1V9YCG2_ACHHY|nr:Amino Acid/Auxin Permease (AAAP) Family [Achlya hypogyna]
MAFLAQEDVKMSIALFCCLYGVGAIGMPGNFAMVGYGLGIVITVLMCAANAYASWCTSKVLLIAPKYVKTFGDVGEWSMGIVGRYLANLSQLIVCVMIPIIFLVLGGSILCVLFPLTFKTGIWILFMALSLLPVCLYPTLKEGTGVIFAGALGALIADFIALAILVHEIGLQNEGLTPPPTNVNFDQFSTVVGNMALVFGAGTIIPVLHREHSDPTRLPRVILFTYVLALIFSLVVGIVGFSQVGCQVPGGPFGYIVFAVATPYLGFISSRGAVILSMISMLVHNMVAFCVVIFPSFYILERRLLGLHPTVIDNTNNYNDLETPEFEKEQRKSEARVSLMEPIEFPSHEAAADYSAPGAYLKASILRTLVVAIATTVAVIGQRDLEKLANFAGASMILLCCIILPVAFYAKVYWKKMSALHKLWAILVLAAGLFIAIYGSIFTGKILFRHHKKQPQFPFCNKTYEDYVFTNRTYYKLPAIKH